MLSQQKRCLKNPKEGAVTLKSLVVLIIPNTSDGTKTRNKNTIKMTSNLAGPTIDNLIKR